MTSTGDFKVAVKLHADASQYTAEFTKASQLAQTFAGTLQSGGSQVASGLQAATTASQALGQATLSSTQQASAGLNQVSTAAQNLGSNLQATGTQATQASQGMDGLTQSSREATQSQQQSRSAGDALIAMLRDQIATTGKSAEELLRYRAAQSGVAAEAAPLILQWQNQKAAQLAAAEAARQEEAAQREVQAAKQRATQAQEQFLAGLREQIALQGKSSTEVLQYRAAQLGVSAEAANSIRLIDEANKKGAISAGQHAQAMRMLPAQMTDVVTSVASGMPIWMVAIQQGGQIKDSFGGAGAAARAMLGAITPLAAGLAVGAAAIGLTAAAYYQGSAEADRYRQALVTTGNASGLTVDQLSQYAKEIDGVVGTQARAAEGLAAFTAAGVEGGAQLRQYTQTAIQWQDATGQAITKTAEQFASLQKDPLNATLKLNEGMNFLTASTFEQIKALTDQGQSAEASRVAMDALDAAMRDRAKNIEQNLGYLERGWKGIKGAAAEAWDAMLNIGRSTSIADQIAKVQAELDKKLQEGPGLFDRAQHNKTVERLRAEIWALQDKADAEIASAAAQEQQAKATQSAIARSQLREKHLSNEEKKTRDLAKAQAVYNEELSLLGSGDTDKRLALEKEHLAVVASINEQYKERKTKGTGGISVTDTDLANMRGQLLAAQQYHQQLVALGSGATELNSAERESLKISEQLRLATDGKTIARLKEKQAIADTLAAQLRSNEGLEQSYKAHQKLIDTTNQDAVALEQRVREQEAANTVFGKGRTAIEQMTLATLEHQLAEAQGSDSFDPKYIAALERKISAQKRFVDALGQADYKAVTAHVDELLRNAQELSRTYEGELALSGLTGLEREKIVAARQVELKYAKELFKIEQSTLTESEKQTARDKLNKARTIETAAAVSQATQNHMAKASDEINRSLTDALMRGFESGKGFAENLADTTENLFRTMVLRPVISAVMAPVSGAINGVVQQGLNAVGLGNSGSNVLSLASMGKDIYSAITGGFGALSGQVAGYVQSAMNLVSGSGGMVSQGPIQIGGFAQGVGSAASLAAGVAGGVYGGRFISGGYSAWGGSSGNSAVNTGTAIGATVGSIFPVIGTAVGALVGGLLGGATNRLFGRKLKDSGIEGVFGGEQGFEGRQFEYYKGGLFRSNKTKYSDLDEEVRAALADQYSAMRLGTENMAQVLGLGTDAIEGFSASFKVSLKGLSQEQANQAIQAEFDKIAESMATAALVTSDYTRSGETAAQTLVRLSGSLVMVNDVLGEMNAALYQSSLAGADMASSLVDFFGSADNFNTATSAYYKNYYSVQKQHLVSLRALQKQLDTVDLTLPELGSDNALLQYTALANAQDLNTEAGREAWAVLMQLSGAFAELTNSAATAAAQLRSNLVSLESKFSGGLDVGYKAEDAIKQLQKAVGGSVIEADIPGLAQILRGSTATQVEAYFREIWSTLSTDEARQHLIDFANSALDVVASDTAARTAAQKSAVDAAWAMLQRSVEAERKIAEQAKQAATDLMAEIGGAVDLLRSNVRSLYGEVDSTAALAATQGRAVIDVALTSGILPGQAELSEAIDAITGQMQRTVYTSQFEADRERLVLAGQLATLEDAGQDQLTVAERQLKAAEDQLEYLDNMLTAGQAQLNALNGVTSSIDGGVLRVEDALSALTAAVLAAQNAKTSGAGGGGGGGGGGGRPSDGITDSVLKQVGDAWWNGDWITAQNMIRGLGISNQQLQDSFNLTHGDLQYLFNHGYTGQNPGTYQFQATDPMAMYAEAKAQGLTLSEVDKIIGANPGDAEAWAKANGLPAFADGGWHGGGWRMVGERGPELAFTGPEHIFSNTDTNRMLGLAANAGPALSASLERLFLQMLDRLGILESLLQTGNNTRQEFADQFDNFTGGGQGSARVRLVNQKIKTEAV